MRVIFAWLLVVWLTTMVFLGVTVGQKGQVVESICTIAEHEVGIVSEVRIETERVQYTVELSQCTVLVNAGRFPLYEAGNKLEISGGSIRQLSDFSEEFSGYRKYLERQDIDAVWSYPALHLRSGHGSDFFGDGIGVSQKIVGRVQSLFPEPAASIVSAMILAERGTIPDHVMEPFRQTGTAHVLAISGLHVAIIAGIIWFIVGIVPLPSGASGWVQSLLVITLLWVYIVFIGAPISSRRAGIFISLVLLAIRLQLLISLPTVLLIAAASLLTINPQLIYDVGFQLSISAVTGIFLANFLIPSRYIEQTTQPIVKRALQGLVVSLGAALGTAPLIALHFDMISPISVLANLLVVPPIPFIIGLSFIALGASFIFMPLALLAAWFASMLISWIILITKMLALIPGAYIPDVHLSASFIPLYYSLVFLLAHLIVKKQNRTWREIWE